MYVSVLGPLQVRNDDGEPVAVSGARLRVLLTRLALDAGHPVPPESLTRAVWDTDAPDGAANALQSLVSRLRRLLGPAAVTSGPAGYVLALPPDAIDAHRFTQAAARGRRELASGDPAAAARTLGDALALWRGDALADAADAPFAAGPAARLHEQRLSALEDRVDARLRLGQAAEVVAELEQLTTEHPLRERLHGQLMTALDAVGRRADALAVYQGVRDKLADELGIDPSPELEAVHLAVLRGERPEGIPGGGPGGAHGGGPSTAATGRVPRGGTGGVGVAAGAVPGGFAGAGAAGAGGAETGAGTPGLAQPARGTGSGTPGPAHRADEGASPGTERDSAGHGPGFAASPGEAHPTGEGASPGAVRDSADYGPGSAASPAVPGPTDLPGPDAGAVPASRPAAPPTNLPSRLTSFVGRDLDRLRLGDLLVHSRLVSVVGPGGAGKTRITLETGTRMLPDFPGGVWFVELASVRDPSDIPQAVLSALGRREVGILTAALGDSQAGSDRDDTLARVVEVLSGRRPTLLILDNCEHLVAEAAALADELLRTSPTLRILTSTREPLGIGGEALYPLGPLPLPPEDADIETALASPAVRLFADRAHAVRPGLVVDAANIGAVLEICRRLDGMPLAIELAAARTRALTPTQIARRLDDRFRLLTGGSRTAMPRHQTLRAVVEWSWDLLDDRERAMLRRLSVFAGGATLEAAEAVLADDGDDALVHPDDVLDLLAGLVDKSLVDMYGSGEPRYRMLETIGAFAAEHRDDDGADAGVAERHVAWCVDLLERTDPRLRTGEQLEALAVIAEEHDNFAIALRLAVDTGDARSAVRLVACMGWYWLVRGHHREAAAWLGDALAMPPDPDRPEAEWRLCAQWFHGLTLVNIGRMSEGIRWIMRSRWTLRRLGRQPDNAMAPLIGVMVSAIQAYAGGAAPDLTELAEHPDPWVRAVADLMEGHVAVNAGHSDVAMRSLLRARARFLAIGDRWGRSSAAGGLSEVYRYAGRFDEYMSVMDECLELVRELGSVEDVPLLLSRRGMLRLFLGDVEGAQQDLDDALEVARDGDTPGGIVLVIGWAGDMARLQGDGAEARRLYAQAFEEMPRARMVPGQMVAFLHLGLAYAADLPEERGAARQALDTAVEAALDSHDIPVVASVAEGLAWWSLSGGDAERGAELLGASVALRGHPDLGSLDAVRVTEAVRAALGVEAYEKAFARGAGLTRDAAIGLMRAS